MNATPPAGKSGLDEEEFEDLSALEKRQAQGLIDLITGENTEEHGDHEDINDDEEFNLETTSKLSIIPRIQRVRLC